MKNREKKEGFFRSLFIKKAEETGVKGVSTIPRVYAGGGEGETSMLVRPTASSEGETSMLVQPTAAEDMPVLPESEKAAETGADGTADPGEIEPDADRGPNIYRGSTRLKMVRCSTGEEFPLRESYLTLGKDIRNVDLYVPNDTVSRHHATITREQDRYYVMDNKSTNGTTIEGITLQPYQKAELFDGAMLSFGSEYYQILSE